jgi:hypothetical protein
MFESLIIPGFSLLDQESKKEYGQELLKYLGMYSKIQENADILSKYSSPLANCLHSIFEKLLKISALDISDQDGNTAMHLLALKTSEHGIHALFLQGMANGGSCLQKNHAGKIALDYFSDTHLASILKGASIDNPTTLTYLYYLMDQKNVARILTLLTSLYFDKAILQSLSLDKLEELLLIVVASDSCNKQKAALIILQALNSNSEWHNYELKINDQCGWDKLDKECLVFALNNFQIPLHKIIEIWQSTQNNRPENSRHYDNGNAQIATELGNMLKRNLILEEVDVAWNFIAQHGLKGWGDPDIFYVREKIPKGEEHLVRSALTDFISKFPEQDQTPIQVVAAHQNLEFIVQALQAKAEYKYHHPNFVAACCDALQIAVSHLRENDSPLCMKLSEILNYLKDFWVLSDEAKIYAQLKEYIGARILQVPELQNSRYLARHKIKPATRTPSNGRNSSRGLLDCGISLIFNRSSKPAKRDSDEQTHQPASQTTLRAGV